MQNKEKNRIITDFFGSQSLITLGARIYDRLLIAPMQGRKRELILNRTHYEIKHHDSYHIDAKNCLIQLPGRVNKEMCFSLELCSHQGNSKINEKSRYLLKAHGGEPFRINGSLTFESFIERGDRIEIGYNRLLFEEREERVTESVVGISNQVIESDLSILIEGETGTGKSYLAKKIHQESRRLGRFVHINLSSFSPSLIESELFGHVKGAFTGAASSRKGSFREADRGTLFLDEIDSLPLEIQTKLLLFLDSKEVRSVGGDQIDKVDVRLIFASGQNLWRLVEKEKVRKDFYYRLSSGAFLRTTALRNDPKRIFELCEQFALENEVSISKQLIDLYQRCLWPGNIRQLMGHLKKKLVLAKSGKLYIDENDDMILSEKSGGNFSGDGGFPSLDMMKKNYCHKVYVNFEKNMKLSCDVLGITPNTLRSILRKAEAC